MAEINLQRIVAGVLLERSLLSLSVKPWIKVLPPVTTTDPYNAGLRSMSHMPENGVDYALSERIVLRVKIQSIRVIGMTQPPPKEGALLDSCLS